MNSEAAILVIDDEHEAILVASAIALHAPRLRVHTVPNWRSAVRYLTDAEVQKILPRLVILGRSAVGEAPSGMPLLGRGEMAVVGLAPDLSARTKDRALAAGVQALYDRPMGWDQYSATVRAILAKWLN